MITRNPSAAELRSRITGLLVGLAVGDALGLPFEGLSRNRAAKMLGPPDRYRFLFGKGMVSDDTEHACMTAQSLLQYSDQPDRFSYSLAWKLRWWLAALPAGTGLATLRAILKLWIGIPPHASGVHSAGNGPAMRAPVIGACLSDDPVRMRHFVNVSTRLTHIDPRAEQGALAVAQTAATAVRNGSAGLDPHSLLLQLGSDVEDSEFKVLIDRSEQAFSEGMDVRKFTDFLGLERGVSGYVYHTVPVALYAFLKHLGSFEKTVMEVIALGGDTDSTGAIAGALAGAAVGVEGIPARWLDSLVEWPRSVDWLIRLAGRMADIALKETSRGPEPLFWPFVIPRNLFYLVVVLVHGFRRLLPPY